MRLYEKIGVPPDRPIAGVSWVASHGPFVVLTIEELTDIWAVANERGHHSGQYGNPGIHPQDLHNYLETKGIILP